MTDTRLEQQLRAEMAREAERVETSPDAWARIQEQADGQHRRTRVWGALGLVGAATAAGVLAVTTLQGPRELVIGPDPAGEAAPTAEVTPPTTTATDGVLSTVSYAWSEIPLEASVPYGRAEGIASGGGRVLVVGEVDGVPTVWLSEDGGGSFTRRPGPSPDGDLETARFADGRFYVGGRGPEGGAAVWSTVDASSWEVEHVGAHPNGTVYGLADGPSGLVAVGEADRGTAIALVQDRRRVWAEEIVGTGGAETIAYHVAGGPDGYVAAGYGAGSIASTWYSADGRTWEDLSAVPGQGIGSDVGAIDVVLRTDEGWAAVQAGGTVWTSRDGRTWTEGVRLRPTQDLDVGYRTYAALPAGPGALLVFAGSTDEPTSAYRVHPATGSVESLAAVEGSSLTVQAEAVRLDDGTVLVPLERADGLFVWRGTPTS